MRAALLMIVVAVSAPLLGASDHTVLFDEDANFTAFKTFRASTGNVTTQRPELGGSTFAKGLADTIIASLAARGLSASATAADLVVDHTVTTIDWSIGSFGRANVVDAGRGRRGGSPPIDFSDGTLVIDLKRADTDALVWRGVYNETEKDAAKLAQLLLHDVDRLLAEYPPQKK